MKEHCLDTNSYEELEPLPAPLVHIINDVVEWMWNWLICNSSRPVIAEMVECKPAEVDESYAASQLSLPIISEMKAEAEKYFSSKTKHIISIPPSLVYGALKRFLFVNPAYYNWLHNANIKTKEIYVKYEFCPVCQKQVAFLGWTEYIYFLENKDAPASKWDSRKLELHHGCKEKNANFKPQKLKMHLARG